MLLVQKGKCTVPFTNLFHMQRVHDVCYKGHDVYFSTRKGILVGKYTAAYIMTKDGNFCQFGEIKFTVGIIENGKFYCNYVLCEY